MTLAPMLLAAASLLQDGQSPERVNEQLMATYQRLSPAGTVLLTTGRPVDMAFTPDGKLLWVKESKGLRLLNVKDWKEVAYKKVDHGMSLTGLITVGDSAYVTSAGSALVEYVLADGAIQERRRIMMPGPWFGGNSFPCGLAVSGDGKKAYVCLSRNNTLGVVDLVEGKLERQIDVGVAPFDVVLLANKVALVTNQGGRRPMSGDATALSAGTETVIDERGVAKTGTVSVVDLVSGTAWQTVAVGLQPSSMAENNEFIAVANSNSDTVTLISKSNYKPVSTVVVKPDLSLPFGSMPNGLAFSKDGSSLYVSCAGNNAVGVIDVSFATQAHCRGFVPTGWYPGKVLVGDGELLVANIKGVGSRTEMRVAEKGRNSHDQSGSLQKIALPSYAELAAMTEKVIDLGRVPQILASLERRGGSGTAPVPVPKEIGDPSPIEHVVYVIKENRTYDQMFGDIAKGSGDPNLCVFPEKVSPNHHALAEEYVLLDNYYCEGVLSADGHSWATEGNVTPYLERAFGGFERSYTFGNDPITYSSTGFIWDYILGKGLSLRNFGEMDDARVPEGWRPTSVWRNYEKGQTVKFVQSIEIENLRRYSSPDYPGWNMAIPDVLRADRFLKEFREMEASGTMPNLTIIYLPQDHTAGTTPGYPTTASYVADNDLALGRIVEAVSKSKFWPKTAIFVNEDDPQAGFDHVDGHRSICLVVSPWAKRGAVVSEFYNQNSVLHTILRIFGLPPMNQQNAFAPIMFDCFTATPDYAPYRVREPQVDLNAVNPALDQLEGDAKYWAEVSAKIPMWRPGLKSAQDDENLNRIIWHSMKGYATRYPSEWAGYHGRGLKQRRLVFGDDD